MITVRLHEILLYKVSGFDIQFGFRLFVLQYGELLNPFVSVLFLTISNYPSFKYVRLKRDGLYT